MTDFEYGGFATGYDMWMGLIISIVFVLYIISVSRPPDGHA